MEIADLTIWTQPDYTNQLTGAELGETLLDGRESTPLARIRGISSELEIHALGTGGYAVFPSRSYGLSVRPLLASHDASTIAHIFERDGEPFSQTYARALLWTTRQMAEEIEAEETGR